MIGATDYIYHKLMLFRATQRLIEDRQNPALLQHYMQCRVAANFYALRLSDAEYNEHPVSDWALLLRHQGFRKDVIFDAYLHDNIAGIFCGMLNDRATAFVSTEDNILLHPSVLENAQRIKQAGLQELAQDKRFVRVLEGNNADLKTSLGIATIACSGLQTWDEMTDQQKQKACSAYLTTDPQGFVEQIDAMRNDAFSAISKRMEFTGRVVVAEQIAEIQKYIM